MFTRQTRVGRVAGATVLALMVVLVQVTPVLAATLFNDSFESGNFSSWTSNDNDWSVSSGSGHSGSKKATVSDQGSSDDNLVKNISTVGYENLTLSYFFKTGQPLESSDHVRVEYWDGSSWNELADYFSLNNGSWTEGSHLLPVGANNLASFKFRFRASGLEHASGGGDKDEFLLDDVTLSGSEVIIDTDADDDGVDDDSDNCPAISNADQADNDNDGIGDVCDNDDDNDGVSDGTDNCPVDANADQADNDNDGIGDVCDNDDDNDSVFDGNDNCPITANADQADNDNDGIGDVCDNDDDNDSITDGSDNCPLTANAGQENTDGDSEGDICDNDDDNDGVSDGTDNCPVVANPDQENTDEDAAGDACDDDLDGDTIQNDADNCPAVANTDQTNTDGDSEGDACDNDDDNDGVSDGTDNCPVDANADQADNDNDGIGDVCDNDDDNDGVNDGPDNCPLIANADQTDSDSDGIGNECDETPYTDEQLCEMQEGYSWIDCECVLDVPPPTDEEVCLSEGGFWNGEGCEEIPQCSEGYSYNENTNECDENVVEEENNGGGDGGGSSASGGSTDPSPYENPAPSDSGSTDESAPADDTSGNDEGSGDGDGEVLGAVCEPLLTTFMREGKKNDSDEVMKLQNFLNAELGLSLDISGIFGHETTQAVNAFQIKYADDILAPWLPFGLANTQTATGYVYKTTQRWINHLHCADLDLPMPMLP